MTMTAAFDHGMVTENQHAECLRQNSDSFECSCLDSHCVPTALPEQPKRSVERKRDEVKWRHRIYRHDTIAILWV